MEGFLNEEKKCIIYLLLRVRILGHLSFSNGLVYVVVVVAAVFLFVPLLWLCC